MKLRPDIHFNVRIDRIGLRAQTRVKARFDRVNFRLSTYTVRKVTNKLYCNCCTYLIPEKWDEDLKCTVSTIINAQVYVRGGVRHDVHVLLYYRI